MAHTLTVDGGRLGGRPWIVHGVEQLEGRDFAPLDKRDTGLSRFVLGVSQGNPLKDVLRRAAPATQPAHAGVEPANQARLAGVAEGQGGRAGGGAGVGGGGAAVPSN